MLGNVDELNSALGVARQYCAEDDNGLSKLLVELQCCLTELMSHLATPPMEDSDDEQERLDEAEEDAAAAAAAAVAAAAADGAEGSGKGASYSKMKQVAFDEDGVKVRDVEVLIDGLDGQMPKLTCFILPSGGRASSALHHARTICRRAERSVYPAVASGVATESAVKFLNRTSDLLFACARFAAAHIGETEQEFKAGRDASRGFGALPQLKRISQVE